MRDLPIVESKTGCDDSNDLAAVPGIVDSLDDAGELAGIGGGNDVVEI
jgi:hypothetical protein